MFSRRKPEPQRLDVPDDVAKLLDAYAQGLSDEFGMPITRQQGFERMVRLFLGNLGSEAKS